MRCNILQHIADDSLQKNATRSEALSRRDSVPYAAFAPILIDTRLHSTRGQFFIRHECGACIRLRTNTSLIRMISRSAYGFSIFVITCLHTSDERVQTRSVHVMYSNRFKSIFCSAYLKASA